LCADVVNLLGEEVKAVKKKAVSDASKEVHADMNILSRVYPLLGNDTVNRFPREPTRATLGKPLPGNGSVDTPP
jgi:hypothetical protein